MYKITEGIYQGGIPQQLPEEVTAVVTLNGLNYRFQDVQFHFLAAVPDADFPGLPWLKTVVQVIDGLRKAGQTVYIHCQAGISRSTMVTAAYLMYSKGLSRDQAVDAVGAKNPRCEPNPYFMRGLKEYEQHLRAK